MSNTIPKSVSTDCRKYAKSKIVFNNFNTFINVKKGEIAKVEKVWLTTSAAMEYLGVSRDFLDNMRNNAKLSFYVFGRTVFFKKEEIDKAIEKCKVV